MSGAAPTNGWDLVYAVRIAQVNAQIVAEKLSPAAFSHDAGDATVEGTFGSWQITTGGSGYLVYLLLPVDGTVTRPGEPAIPFSGSVKLAVELNYLPVSPAETTRQALQIAGSPAGAGDRVATIQDLTLAPDPGFIADTFIRTALQLWLAENIAVLNRVFAVVDMTQVTAEAPYAWLKPTSLSYAYVDGPEAGDGVLAILAMTQGRSAGTDPQQVAVTLIPDGADAALAISSSLLLDSVVRNALPVTFPGTTIADYTLATDSPTLSLVAPRQLGAIDYQGTTYQPLLESFSVEFTGSQIVCKSQSSIPAGDGVTCHTSVLATQGLTLATNAQGEPTLAFTEIGSPQVSHWTTTDPDTDQTDEAIGYGLMAAGVLAAIFTGGIAGIFVIAAGVVVGGVIANLPELISDWTPDTAPSLDLMAVNMTSPFTWTGGTAFAVASADLAESMRLSGTPWPQASGISQT